MHEFRFTVYNFLGTFYGNRWLEIIFDFIRYKITLSIYALLMLIAALFIVAKAWK